MGEISFKFEQFLMNNNNCV